MLSETKTDVVEDISRFRWSMYSFYSVRPVLWGKLRIEKVESVQKGVLSRVI